MKYRISILLKFLNELLYSNIIQPNLSSITDVTLQILINLFLDKIWKFQNIQFTNLGLKDYNLSLNRFYLCFDLDHLNMFRNRCVNLMNE